MKEKIFIKKGKKNTKNKISIAINKEINLKLEENSINKSKLINSLIKNFFDKNNDFTKFVKKVS